MCHFQSGLLDSRSLIRPPQQSIARSHCSGPALCMLMRYMDWEISQTELFTLISISCIVKPPSSCQIAMVSAAHWLTLTQGFLAQMGTCRVTIWMILASAKTDFGNPEASPCISGSQRRSWLSGGYWMVAIQKNCRGCWICCQWCCDAVAQLRRVCQRFWLLYVRGAGKANIEMGFKGIWFIDWTLKFITNTTKSMLCS